MDNSCPDLTIPFPGQHLELPTFQHRFNYDKPVIFGLLGDLESACEKRTLLQWLLLFFVFDCKIFVEAGIGLIENIHQFQHFALHSHGSFHFDAMS